MTANSDIVKMLDFLTAGKIDYLSMPTANCQLEKSDLSIHMSPGENDLYSIS